MLLATRRPRPAHRSRSRRSTTTTRCSRCSGKRAQRRSRAAHRRTAARSRAERQPSTALPTASSASSWPPRRAVDDLLDGLRAVMLQPVEVGGRRVDVARVDRASPPGAGDAATIADRRMRSPPRRRCAAGVFWRADAAPMTPALERRSSLMGELDDALAAGQIEVFYQPKLRSARRPDHQRRGAGALAASRRAASSAPTCFIPLAEQTDRIAPLTLFVLTRVIATSPHWRVDRTRSDRRDQHLGQAAVVDAASTPRSSALLARDRVPTIGAGLRGDRIGDDGRSRQRRSPRWPRYRDLGHRGIDGRLRHRPVDADLSAHSCRLPSSRSTAASSSTRTSTATTA